MNRRSFLTKLGVAAVGAAALAVEDPERLLWVPGAKTIVDFGATKQVLPATDAEMGAVFLAEQVSAEEYRARFISTPGGPNHEWLKKRFTDPLLEERDIRLDIGGTSFKYKGDKLVSLHSEAELAKLDTPFFRPGEFERARRDLAARRRL